MTKTKFSRSQVKKIGKGKWRAGPFRSWVTKSDVIELLRCPYRVYLSHQLKVPPIEFVDPQFIKAVVEQGSQFEESIVSQLPFEDVESLESVIDRKVIFREPSIIENHQLGIRGIVDLIDVEGGDLYPIEIKMHKELTDFDRLELAFYWKLLHPLRKSNPKPKGYIPLNTGETLEVVLYEDDLLKASDLIAQVRTIKETGCEPIICQECKNCTLFKDCLERVHQKGGLSLIHGIAYVRNQQLEALGIRDINSLATADALNLAQQWKRLSPWAPGEREIQKMIFHAMSWQKLEPICFDKSPLPTNKDYIIMDLEYDPYSPIWLVGLLVVENATKTLLQFFAESKNAEKEILAQLVNALNDYPSYKVLTWYGCGADIPQLALAWYKYSLPKDTFRDLLRRHLDLYQIALNRFRFPLKSFGLKEVGKHLGFVRKHDDINGLIALTMYNEYLKLSKKNDKKAEALKTTLLEYNEEDLKATYHVLTRLESLRNRD